MTNSQMVLGTITVLASFLSIIMQIVSSIINSQKLHEGAIYLILLCIFNAIWLIYTKKN